MLTILSCLKIIFAAMDTNEGKQDPSKALDKNISKFIMFTDKCKPLENIGNTPLIISDLNKSSFQLEDTFTVRFCIFSKKDREDDLKDLLKNNDLSNLDEFSAMQQNKGVIKMIFEANLDFNESANPVKAQTIFPKDKKLFNLEATKDSINDNNFNLNLRFTCDSYNEAEFSEAIKTDDSLFGLALITQGEKLVHIAPLIQIESLSNIHIILFHLNFEIFTFEKKQGDLQNEIKSLKNVPLTEITTKFKNIETDLKNFEDIYNSLLQKIDALPRSLENSNEKFSYITYQLKSSKKSLDKIETDYFKEHESYISKAKNLFKSLLKEIDERLRTFEKQHDALLKHMKSEKLEEKDLQDKFSDFEFPWVKFIKMRKKWRILGSY